MRVLKPYQIASIAVVCVVIFILLLLGNPVYTKVGLGNEFMWLETDKRINEDFIYLHRGDSVVLYFIPWEMKLNYGGEERRVFGYDSNESWFNGGDSKRIEVSRNEMVITYFNKSKDPSAISILFRLEGDILKYKIRAEVLKPEELHGIVYGYRFKGLGYREIITPSDEVIKNEGQQSFTFTRLQIPEVTKDFQLMVSDDIMLNISGEFESIWNSLKWQVSHFYTDVDGSISIRVQDRGELKTPEKGLYLITDERLSENIVHLYEGGEEILYFRPEEMGLNYRGEEKVVFEYDNPEAYFNKSDSKRVEVSGNEMVITYFNKSKDPSAISILFRLEGDGIKYDIVPEVAWPIYLEGVYYGYNFGGLGYREITTPTGNVINATGNATHTDILIGSKTWNDYQSMISDERILNFSGDFTKTWNSLKWQVSHLYSEGEGGVYINVQDLEKGDVPKDEEQDI